MTEWHSRRFKVDNGQVEDIKQHLKNYFDQQETLFGEYISISWRRPLEEIGDVYFINSREYGHFIAFIQPYPNKENILRFELSLTFPQNNKKKQKKLVEDIKKYMENESSKLEKSVL